MEAGDSQSLQNAFIPGKSVDIEEHGAGGIGVIRHMGPAAGQFPDEPCIHRAEEQPPFFRLLSGTLHIFQDPQDFW